MPASLIPALDPAPLPGPPWIFHVLWVLTFLIHLVFMNAVLGGSLLALLARVSKPGGNETRALLVEVNSWAISFAVTFGIAPLLFAQVLLGRFFYTATILVGWAWFGMLVLLTVGYYLNYVAKYRIRRSLDAGIVLALEAICFFAIAAIQVAVNLLHQQPARWEKVADSAWAALADPSFLPRFLHFVLAAVAMAGALLLVVLAQTLDPLAQAAKVRRVAELVVGAMVLMVVTRHQIRGLYLAPARAGENPTVSPQWDAFALFLVVFVLCVGLTVYASVRAARDRPA